MTDVQTSKVVTEALVKGSPDVQTGKVAMSALVKEMANPRVGKIAFSVLFPFTGSPPPPSAKRRVACVIT